MHRLKQFVRLMGPGLLYAGAAVGVSHLVQSTRAGADFGFQLVWAVLLANVMKYPFFQFAPRYTAATGNTLIEGYAHLGKWAVGVYMLITLLTMFVIQAAITIVTAGLFGNVLGLNIEPIFISASILLFTLVILALGKYSLLDKLIKWIILLLTISTIVALIASVGQGFHPQEEFLTTFDFTLHLGFLIALFGWMPAPLDISVWQSIWAKAKLEEQGIKISKRQALLDFNIGYIGTALLAVGFVALGAFVMYGSGEKLSDSGAAFAGQLIHLYTASLGSWSYVIIATAAVMTMVSTSFTCHDAYARAMTRSITGLFPMIKAKYSTRMQYGFWLAIVAFGTVLLLWQFGKSMIDMIDFATILSFIVAPLFGILNYKVITHSHVPKEHQPGMVLKIYAWLGIIFLVGFSIYYIYYRLNSFYAH